MQNAIRAKGVHKLYGERRALDGFTADIRRNSCTGIMGPNGAGKSTFTRLLYGRTTRDSGALEVLGLDPGRESGALKSQIGVVTQDNFLDADLDTLHNLVIFGIYQGMRSREARRRAEECLELFSLSDRRREPVMELSGGMQRRLALARAMMHDPRLILLDEPTTGLDPVARLDLWHILESMTDDGRTIVLSTHYLDEAERLCDEIIVVDHGRVIDQDSPARLIERHVGSHVADGGTADARDRPATLDDLYIELFGRRKSDDDGD